VPPERLNPDQKKFNWIAFPWRRFERLTALAIVIGQRKSLSRPDNHQADRLLWPGSVKSAPHLTFPRPATGEIHPTSIFWYPQKNFPEKFSSLGFSTGRSRQHSH
jgi:hypothetical protein